VDHNDFEQTIKQQPTTPMPKTSCVDLLNKLIQCNDNLIPNTGYTSIEEETLSNTQRTLTDDIAPLVSKILSSHPERYDKDNLSLIPLAKQLSETIFKNAYLNGYNAILESLKEILENLTAIELNIQHETSTIQQEGSSSPNLDGNYLI